MPDWMDGTSIAFPNLGLFFEYIPKTFKLFGIEIAMYGLLIGIGVILAFTLISHTAKKDGMDPEDFYDMGMWVLVVGILGARIYYVIFMWDFYKNDLLSILNIRQGGLAIYGGVLAGFATAIVWCKVRKKNLFAMTDIAFLGVLVGQSIGRWGNFTNREVFGGYTDSLFAMRLPIEAVRSVDISPDLQAHIIEGTNYIQVHPTFLYESFCNLILLILMYTMRGKKKFDGEMTCWYLGGYGIIRFIIEGIRTDQLKFAGTNIAVSQCLGMLLFVIAAVAEVVVRYRQNKYRKNTK
ncbi:MAG: prolipoprotein diacylglyceryl transferase [Lachnospiraceae bacterium]|nr:prolipoprotein diacylglyceryl transferase [Lachnospiraceae bacterium]